MSTRGTFGFYDGKKSKLGYNHFDSYPDGLGAAMAEWICSLGHAVGTVHICLQSIYDGWTPITTGDHEAVLPEVRTSLLDWASKHSREPCAQEILRFDKGNMLNASNLDMMGFGALRLGCPYFVPQPYFITDSLFCEYGYIYNLEESCMEFWKGFQKKPDPTNRYGTLGDGEYYPCRLFKKYPLADILGMSIDDLIADIHKALGSA